MQPDPRDRQIERLQQTIGTQNAELESLRQQRDQLLDAIAELPAAIAELSRTVAARINKITQRPV